MKQVIFISGMPSPSAKITEYLNVMLAFFQGQDLQYTTFTMALGQTMD